SISLVDETAESQGRIDDDADMFDVNDLQGEEVIVAGKKDKVIEETIDEITLAEALMEIKKQSPKWQELLLKSQAKNLKGKSFDVINKMFDKAYKRVNTFVAMDTEVVEGSGKKAAVEESSLKRAGTELEQEVTKKQKIDDAKVDDDQEKSKMKELMVIIPNKEKVAIDDIPLATKPSSIVN
nr:hypothetical protein [Tanacetum cinerariifolium]